MSNDTTEATSPLEITYTGAPITIDPTKITSEMTAPREHIDGGAEDGSGSAIAELFDTAVREGALVIPEGIRAVCYAVDDEDDGGGVFLVAFRRAPGHERGVTTGWTSSGDMAVAHDDEDEEVTLVARVLDGIAADLNTALGLHDLPSKDIPSWWPASSSINVWRKKEKLRESDGWALVHHGLEMRNGFEKPCITFVLQCYRGDDECDAGDRIYAFVDSDHEDGGVHVEQLD